MKLSRSFIFFAGLLLLITYFVGKKIVLFATGKFTEGQVIWHKDNVYTNHYRQSGSMSQSNLVCFSYNHSAYSFTTVSIEEQSIYHPVKVIFNPNDPSEAYIYDFLNYWAFSFCWVAIGLVPLAAAVFSFISKNERFEISRQKIGLVKISPDDDE